LRHGVQLSRWEVCQLLDRSKSRSQSNAVFGLIAFLNCSTIAVAYKGHVYRKFTIFLRFHPDDVCGKRPRDIKKTPRSIPANCNVFFTILNTAIEVLYFLSRDVSNYVILKPPVVKPVVQPV